MTDVEDPISRESGADPQGRNEALVMPDGVPDELKGSVMPEPPFCAWCGGTCECEDFYDEDPNEGDYCDCPAIHDDEEIANNCCKCCGGIVEA